MDCRNYAPVDVAKGICHRDKQTVLADDPNCEFFEPTQKCKFCSHYVSSQEEQIGLCGAVPNKPWTYPELITVTCEWFARKAS